jgi:hypothetical protein
MTYPLCRFIKPASFLIILCILAAGCASKTDVQPPAATPVPPKYLTKEPTRLTPFPTTQATVLGDGSKTCSQLQGSIATPGQECPGTWLKVSDGFSCCSNTPVVSKTIQQGLVVEPLDLRILHNATFVGIGTG